jgi:2'-5' RNA ligase
MAIRLFFALKPPREQSSAIAALGQHLTKAHGLRGRPVGPGHLHVTLAGAWAEHLTLPEAIWRAQALAMPLAAELRGLPVRFDFTGSFAGPDRHPFVLRGADGLAELAAFRARLRRAMLGAGFSVPSSFTPHMTLIWGDRCVEDYPVAPITWLVSDLLLILSADGDHIQLGRWRLT